MANRLRVPEQIPSVIENPTAEQLKKFYIIARNLNDPRTIGTVTDDDFKFFMSVGVGGFDEAKFNSLAAELNKERKEGDPPVNPEVVRQFVDQARLQVASPENKDRLARLFRAEDIKNKTTAFSNAANLFLAGADLSAAQRQINEYKRGIKALAKPGAMPVLGRDPYLQAAVRAAETAPARETVSAMAASQQLGDIYRGELMQAPVAAAGQTGAFGALGQAAATRRRRGALEMMPALEQIRAQQQSERAQLAGASAAESARINQSMQEAQRAAQSQYIAEQQALAGLGQAGYANRLSALGGLAAAAAPVIAGTQQRRMSTAPVVAPVEAPYTGPTLDMTPVPMNFNTNTALRGGPISFENPINKYTSTAIALGIPQNKIDEWGWNTWTGNAPASFRRSARMAGIGNMTER